VKTIVFDKTGTLTIGKPIVVNTKLYKNMALQVFYETIAAAEVCFDPTSQLRRGSVRNFLWYVTSEGRGF
jgi:magnesium-transporting ATPase (P-type)